MAFSARKVGGKRRMWWSAKQLFRNFTVFHAATRLHHISHTPVPKSWGVTASPRGEAFGAISQLPGKRELAQTGAKKAWGNPRLFLLLSKHFCRFLRYGTIYFERVRRRLIALGFDSYLIPIFHFFHIISIV